MGVINKRRLVLLPVFLVVAIFLTSALMPKVTEAEETAKALFPAGQGSASMTTTVGFYGPTGEPIKVDDSWATQSMLIALKSTAKGGSGSDAITLKEYKKDHTVESYSCQIHKITIKGTNINPDTLYGDWVVRFIRSNGKKITVPGTKLDFDSGDFDIQGDTDSFTATWYPTGKGIFRIPLKEFGKDNNLNWDEEGFTWTFQIEADFHGYTPKGDRIKATPFGKKYSIRTSPVVEEEENSSEPSLVATVETAGQESGYTSPSADNLYADKVCNPMEEYCPVDTRLIGGSVLPIGGDSIKTTIVFMVILVMVLWVWIEVPLGGRKR